MKSKFNLDDVSLVRAKKILVDLQENIHGERRNLCEASCKYFVPTKIMDRIKRQKEEGFGMIGRCTAESNSEVPELNIPVWKCEIKEREIREVIKRIEEQIIKAVGDNIPTAKQFINYKESINRKFNFIVMILYIMIAVTVMVGIKLHLEINELKKGQKVGVESD